ncbi:lysyl-tRNA synthetase (class II), partial [Trifolium pratense]
MGEALKLLNLTWHPLKNNFYHFSTCAFRRTPRTLLIRASSSSTTASGRNRRSSSPSSSTSTSDREAIRAIRLKKV